MKRTARTRKELRAFGMVMTVPLALIGSYLWWKGAAAAPYVLGAAGFFLLSGLATPQLLRPIEALWMKLALVLSAVVTRIILTLAFLLVITPMGLALRAMGKDLLRIRPGADGASYWVPIDADGPGSRPFKPY